MARYDKYDPKVGGFRAPMNADLTLAAFTALDSGNPVAVRLNTSGKVVVGGATETFGDDSLFGLLIITKSVKANDIVDVMTAGEIVEMAGKTAGDTIWALAATGVLDSLPPTVGINKLRVGRMVEATRLIVRCQTVQGGA